MVKYQEATFALYRYWKDIDIKWNENDSKDNYRSSLVLTGEKFVEASLTDAETYTMGTAGLLWSMTLVLC